MVLNIYEKMQILQEWKTKTYKSVNKNVRLFNELSLRCRSVQSLRTLNVAAQRVFDFHTEISRSFSCSTEGGVALGCGHSAERMQLSSHALLRFSWAALVAPRGPIECARKTFQESDTESVASGQEESNNNLN